MLEKMNELEVMSLFKALVTHGNTTNTSGSSDPFIVRTPNVPLTINGVAGTAYVCALVIIDPVQKTSIPTLLVDTGQQIENIINSVVVSRPSSGTHAFGNLTHESKAVSGVIVFGQSNDSSSSGLSAGVKNAYTTLTGTEPRVDQLINKSSTTSLLGQTVTAIIEDVRNFITSNGINVGNVYMSQTYNGPDFTFFAGKFMFHNGIIVSTSFINMNAQYNINFELSHSVNRATKHDLGSSYQV